MTAPDIFERCLHDADTALMWAMATGPAVNAPRLNEIREELNDMLEAGDDRRTSAAPH